MISTVPCAGDPASGEMFTCDAVATLGAMQLRPGYLMTDSDSAEPVLVLIAVCRDHLRPVRNYLRATWSHDPIDVYGLEFLHRNWNPIDGMLEDTPMMQLVPQDLIA